MRYLFLILFLSIPLLGQTSADSLNDFVDANVVAFWYFSDTNDSLSMLKDLSGNGRNVTAQGNTAPNPNDTIAGPFTNGTDEVAQILSSDNEYFLSQIARTGYNVAAGGAFTIDCWVYWPGDVGNTYVFSRYFGSSSPYTRLRLRPNNNTAVLEIQDDNAGTPNVFNTVQNVGFSPGQWYAVTYSCDFGTDSLTLYVNGEIIGHQDVSGITGNITGAYDITIGRFGATYTTVGLGALRYSLVARTKVEARVWANFNFPAAAAAAAARRQYEMKKTRGFKDFLEK